MTNWTKHLVALAAAMGLVAGAAGRAGAVTTTYLGAGGAIPDPGTLTTDITVGDHFSITDVTVTLTSLSHTFVGDLVVTIAHLDTGTSVDLFNRAGRLGGSGDGDPSRLSGNYAFNDAFAGEFWGAVTADHVFVAGGAYYPSTADNLASSLSVFDGEGSAGTWRLTVSDLASGNRGSLGSWALALGSGVAAVPEPASLASGALAVAILGLGYRWRRGRAA